MRKSRHISKGVYHETIETIKESKIVPIKMTNEYIMGQTGVGYIVGDSHINGSFKGRTICLSSSYTWEIIEWDELGVICLTCQRK